MKQLFLSLLLCTSFVGIQAGYTPAAGPLTLGDSGPAHHLTRGAIMKAVIDNKPANPNSNLKLAAANLDLADFDGRGQAFRTYQEIMHNISQSTNAEAALQAAKAIETVIMHLYDYDTYALGSYKPCRSIFMTGIRYHSIFSDDEKLKQLIDELENLANTVSVHSKSMSLRLKTTVYSYRHWRRNMALTCAACLAWLEVFGPKNTNYYYTEKTTSLWGGKSFGEIQNGELIKSFFGRILSKKDFHRYTIDQTRMDVSKKIFLKEFKDEARRVVFERLSKVQKEMKIVEDQSSDDSKVWACGSVEKFEICKALVHSVPEDLQRLLASCDQLEPVENVCLNNSPTYCSLREFVSNINQRLDDCFLIKF